MLLPPPPHWIKLHASKEMSIMEEEDDQLADMFVSLYGSVRILLVE